MREGQTVSATEENTDVHFIYNLSVRVNKRKKYINETKLYICRPITLTSLHRVNAQRYSVPLLKTSNLTKQYENDCGICYCLGAEIVGLNPT